MAQMRGKSSRLGGPVTVERGQGMLMCLQEPRPGLSGLLGASVRQETVSWVLSAAWKAKPWVQGPLSSLSQPEAVGSWESSSILSHIVPLTPDCSQLHGEWLGGRTKGGQCTAVAPTAEHTVCPLFSGGFPGDHEKVMRMAWCPSVPLFWGLLELAFLDLHCNQENAGC